MVFRTLSLAPKSFLPSLLCHGRSQHPPAAARIILRTVLKWFPSFITKHRQSIILFIIHHAQKTYYMRSATGVSPLALSCVCSTPPNYISWFSTTASNFTPTLTTSSFTTSAFPQAQQMQNIVDMTTSVDGWTAINRLQLNLQKNDLMWCASSRRTHRMLTRDIL